MRKFYQEDQHFKLPEGCDRCDGKIHAGKRYKSINGKDKICKKCADIEDEKVLGSKFIKFKKRNNGVKRISIPRDRFNVFYGGVS